MGQKELAKSQGQMSWMEGSSTFFEQLLYPVREQAGLN